MTLEAALAANTAALEKHTAVLEQFISLAGSAKSASGDKTERSSKTDKGSKGSKGSKSKAADPWDSEATFLEFVTGFLRSTEDKDEKKKCGAAVKPILEHFGVAKFSELGSDTWEECCGYIQLLKDHVESEGYDGLEDVDLGLSNESGSEDESLV